MADIGIKLKIADREYPMKVATEDEERIRKIGREINDRLRNYQEKYRLDDRQDLLAMVAFDALMDRDRQQANRAETDRLVSDRLSNWETLVAQAIQEQGS